MFKQKSLQDMFKQTGLDAESMSPEEQTLEKVIGANIAFNVTQNVDETLPADELYLQGLFSDYAKLVSAEAQHDGLEATVETALEQGGARGAGAVAISNWYTRAAANLGKYAAEGVDAESFAEVGGALDATTRIKDAVVANKATITLAKNNVGREITKVLNSLFGNYAEKAAKVTDKITKVTEASAEATGVAKEENVTFDGMKHVVDGTKGTQVFQALSTLSETKFTETLQGVREVLEAVTAGEGDVDAAFQKLSDAIRNDLAIKPAEGFDAEGFEALSYEPEMAGAKLVVALPTAGNVAAPSLQITPSEEKAESVPHAEATEVLGTATDIIEAVKAVSEAGRTLMTGIEEAYKGEVKAEYASTAIEVVSFCGEVVKALVSQGIVVAEAHANYAMASVNNLVEEKEEAPAPATEENNGETETQEPTAEPAAEGTPAEEGSPAEEAPEANASTEAPETDTPAEDQTEATADTPAEQASEQEPAAEGTPAEPAAEEPTATESEPAQEPVAEPAAEGTPAEQEPAAEGAPAEEAEPTASQEEGTQEPAEQEPAASQEEDTPAEQEPAAEGTPAEGEVDAENNEPKSNEGLPADDIRATFNMFEPAKKAL